MPGLTPEALKSNRKEVIQIMSTPEWVEGKSVA
jgi:hypothetical protein